MSLIFGLCAALAWAIHDLCVRRISQNAPILPSLLTVLVIGAALVTPVAIWVGNWGAMTGHAYRLSAASGTTFGLASFALYGAFAIGPVRLVAPIIGAYPVLSLGWAVATGTPISALQWIAVLLIVAGVAVVAVVASDDTESGKTGHAILYSLIAGTGFAATFILAQGAVRQGADWPVILAARAAAIATIGITTMVLRQAWQPERRILPMLTVMGLLDAGALAFVTTAGRLPHPEFAAVTASMFGLLTVVLARVILKEPMTRLQWAATAGVFAGVAYLGFG